MILVIYTTFKNIDSILKGIEATSDTETSVEKILLPPSLLHTVLPTPSLSTNYSQSFCPIICVTYAVSRCASNALCWLDTQIEFFLSKYHWRSLDAVIIFLINSSISSSLYTFSKLNCLFLDKMKNMLKLKL